MSLTGQFTSRGRDEMVDVSRCLAVVLFRSYPATHHGTRTGTGTGASTSTMYTQSQTHLPPSRYCTPAALTEHSIGRDRRAQHSVHSVSLCAVCTLISVRSDLRPYLLSPVRQSVRLPLASPSRPVCLCPAAAGCGSSNFAFRGALKLYDLPLQS